MGYWTGQDCELDEEECSKDSCHNNGTCIEAVGGPPTCICEPGKCINVPGTYICVCVGYWTGQDCELDGGECSKEPCHNNGTCIEAVGGPPTFICEPGKCINVPGTYICVCVGYWTGQDCELDEEECSKDPCHNNGTCIEAVGGPPTCICEPGKCINVYGTYICVCVGYWTGQDCELDKEECSKDPCHNNGTCIEAVGGPPTCICEPGKCINVPRYIYLCLCGILDGAGL